jgi:hypothetical protein
MKYLLGSWLTWNVFVVFLSSYKEYGTIFKIRPQQLSYRKFLIDICYRIAIQQFRILADDRKVKWMKSEEKPTLVVVTCEEKPTLVVVTSFIKYKFVFNLNVLHLLFLSLRRYLLCKRSLLYA